MHDLPGGCGIDGLLGLSFLKRFNYEIRSVEGRILIDHAVDPSIAFGIDQLRALKPIGVLGLSIALPISQLAFLRGVWSRNRLAFLLGCVSFAGLVFTMILAWRNELSTPLFELVAGIRGMVSVHGVLNTAVVAPRFLLAVSLDRSR